MSHPIASSTSTGLAPNIGGALAYLLGPITGILFLVLEKRSTYVRFHAAQSLVLAIAWVAFSIAFTVVETALGFIPLIGWIIAIVGLLVSMVLLFAGFALWLLLMYRAYQGEQWKLPLVGGYAHRLIGDPPA